MLKENNICIVYIDSTGDFYGGAEFSLLDLINNLDRSKFFPIVVVPFIGDFAKELMKNGIEVVDLGVNKLPGLSSYIFGYKAHNPILFILWLNKILILKSKTIKKLKDKNIFLIHGNSFPGNIFGAMTAKKLQIPFIAHLRELPPRTKIVGWIYKILVRKLVINNSINSIAISKAVRDSYIRNKEKNSMRIVIKHNPLDVKDFFPSRKQRLSWRREYKIPFDGIAIGLVGRFVEWKGHLDAIEAFKIVHSHTSKPVKLFFVGDMNIAHKQYVTLIKHKVDDMHLDDVVCFLGFMKDIKQFYNGIDILIVPSHSEPLGRIVLEAMAMKKVVIATNVGGPAEIITDGVDGFLVKPRFPREMASKILYVINNHNVVEKICDTARKTINDRFNPHNYYTEIENLYEEIICQEK